jgi:gas vesicle protein
MGSASDRSMGTAITFLLIGLGAGAAVALLLAPKAGKQVRRDLRRGYRDVRRGYEDTLDRLQDLKEEAMDRMDEMIEKGSDLADSLREKAAPFGKGLRRVS